MLFQPAIIALLLASLLSVAMLAAAAPFAAQLIRHWNIASGSELQLRLERRTYLFSTLTAVRFRCTDSGPAAVRLQRRPRCR
jgi:hypothetical protein